MLALALAGCGDDGGPATGPDAGGPDAAPAPDAAPPAEQVTREQVVEHYATIVHATYQDALTEAEQLRDAIDRFVAAPSAARMEAAKRAWLEARVVYGQSEAYRFYDGPIDDPETGPEGQLNAWPLDEAYIDYVVDPTSDPTNPVFIEGGIVNDDSITIDKESLASHNEGGEGDIFGVGDTFDPEKAVSIGYHAIEFLLWGQDRDPEGPGSRPFQDYLTGGEATMPNGDRRGQYLQVAAELLVDDLTGLVAAWAPDTADNYRAEFVGGDPDVALARMLSGIGILSKGELASERMDVALRSLDQEDEHSCFSDNTHIDIEMNARGIQNVYLGRYDYLEGPSVSDLVRQIDPELDRTMRDELEAGLQAIKDIPVPFDQAIPQQGSESWLAVDAAVKALFAQSDTIIEVGQALGLGNVSVELPE
ncbi:imelysin family protein [Haliangium sp.]|uniref:imelysin family protein n=1 Tax=Haliangium sp. TaxID=2663208 RepID=UPI003D11C840